MSPATRPAARPPHRGRTRRDTARVSRADGNPSGVVWGGPAPVSSGTDARAPRGPGALLLLAPAERQRRRCRPAAARRAQCSASDIHQVGEAREFRAPGNWCVKDDFQHSARVVPTSLLLREVEQKAPVAEPGASSAAGQLHPCKPGPRPKDESQKGGAVASALLLGQQCSHQRRRPGWVTRPAHNQTCRGSSAPAMMLAGRPDVAQLPAKRPNGPARGDEGNLDR